MAPVRRYLRITKYSVLECRIYVDNPALTQSWLLNPRNNILPRVIESVRPYVLPKLREEKERALSRKKTKKKGIKDVVVEDDFEVSLFLTETETRHSILTKQKHFRENPPNKLVSNSSKLIGETNEAPFDVDKEAAAEPIVLREESDDDAGPNLDSIPSVDETSHLRRGKRRRATATESRAHVQADDGDGDGDDDDESEELFVGPSDEDEDSPIEVGSEDEDEAAPAPQSKRRKKNKDTSAAERRTNSEEQDDKKKMAMDISFEGFAIHGRALCLVVKKRDGLARPSVKAGKRAAGAGAGIAQPDDNKPGGQAMMENWISSTQMPNPGAEVDVS